MSIQTRYKPKHEPACTCAVCTTSAFVEEMHARNEARQKRVHEILNNPFGHVRRPSFWSLERHEKGTHSYQCATPTNRKANNHDRHPSTPD